MDPTKRIVVNTFAQYTRAIINTFLSLYSTRLILGALGMSDYGIYTVVAGVIALLGFITNALVITTQRYISFYNGRGEKDYVSRLFSNSLFLHFVISFFIGLVLWLLQPILFSNVLNIDPARIDVAKIIYILTICMLFCTIMTAPFKAVLIAHENIVYISIVEVCDGVLRLIFAISLSYMRADTLLLFGFMMLGIACINMFAYSFYALIRFEECHIRGVLKDIDRTVLSKFSGFAGWTTYGMGCVVSRTQGFAIILNHFFGTVINAAYGIANHVYASVAIISTSILNAMNPQIMKAEGNGNRKKMLFLAEQESKYSEMLMMIVLIPFMFEMPAVLHFWLGQGNGEMVMLTRFTLLVFMLDQCTYGLNTANQALGNIRNYCLLIYTPRLIFLPTAYILFHYHFSVEIVMWVYVGLVCIISFLRIPYIKYTAGLSFIHFVKVVFLPLLPLLFCQIVIGWFCTTVFDFQYRFLLTIFLSVMLGFVVAFFFVLSSEERKIALNMIKKGRGNK